MDINSELLKINEELKAEVARHRETTRLLTEKQQFLSNILTNAPIVIWCIDNEGNFTYSQFAGENALPDSERIGKSALEIYKGTEVETFIRKVIKDEIQNAILYVHGVVYDSRVSPLFDAYGNKTGYMGVSMDITDRVKTEKELEKFRLVLDQAPGAVFIMDKNWNFEYINPFFTQMSGYTSEELLHKNIRDTLYKGITDVPESRKEIIASLLQGKNWNGELLTIHKSGERYWANTIASPFKNEKGEIDGYVVIQQDITEKKQLELALAEQEKLYRTLIEKSLDGVSITQDSRIIMANQSFCEMFGYSLDELLQTDPTRLIAPEDNERVLNYHYTRMKGEVETGSYSAKFIHKSGKEIIVDINAATVMLHGKNASFVTMRDVTERLKFEKALRDSELKHKTLVENSQDGIIITQDGKFKFVNSAMCRMLNYTSEEFYSMDGVEIIPEQHREKIMKIHSDRMKGLVVPLNYSLQLVSKDKRVIEVEIQSSTVDFDGKPAAFMTLHDITESKKMQRALFESEKKYRELTEMLPQTIYELDKNGNIIYFNQTGFNQFGLDINDIGKSSFNFIHPSQHEQMRLNMQRTIVEKKNSYGNKYTAVRKNGETFPAMTYAAPIISDEKVVGIRGLILDISEHEAMENALRASEQKYRELTEMLPQAIYELDLNGNITFLNQTGIKKLGITNSGMGQSAFNYIIPEDHEKMKVNMKNSLMEKTTSSGNDYTAVRADGTTFPVLIFAAPMLENGIVTGTRGILLDMSEQVAMENALRESEKRYRELAEMLPQTVYEHDTKGKLTFLNQAGKKTFIIENLEPDISAHSLVVADDIDRMIINMQKSYSGNMSSHGNTYTAIRTNGEKFPVMIFATPMISAGKITGTRGIVIDMTEYVAMENALRESEEKYRTLIEKAVDGIIITQHGKLKFVNKAFCELIQYNEEELIGKPYLDYVVPDDHQLMNAYHKRRMEGEEFQTMYRSKIYKKDGSVLEVELNTRTSEYNKQPAAFVIIRDITDRMQTEEELRKAKTELELLNQNLEIRVKESTLKLTEANTQLIRLQKENLQSQFEVLRQQVNPHFLFNSLNVLTSLIKLEPDLAEQFTEHLSKVYRYVLENKDNDLVSLQTELDFLDAYIFLLNIRFMDKIVVKVDIADNKKELLILPLALQLLIENAIKHNSMSKKNPLKIEITIENKNVLNVMNNLQERESHMVSTGVGLRNIEHRYHLLEMPKPEFIKTETKFIARIPLK